MKYLFVFSLFTISIVSFGQTFQLSGNIRDASTGEDLFQAVVMKKDDKSSAVFSNSYGYYSIALPPGKHTIQVSYFGYRTLETVVEVKANSKLNFSLTPDSQTLDEVVVTDQKESENVKSVQMSAVSLNPKDVESVPVIFGERDILKTIQLMPGVKSSGDGGTGFSVRGGGLDQNLILLDEAPVYNAAHLMGFFSVFNSDALKDATLYKGGVPASYGGRASSVLDVKMKEGNNQTTTWTGGVGLISSRLTVETPIVKDKGSVMISGRRTYADIFLKLSGDPDLEQSTLYFYDLNLKANYRFGENDRVFISGYFGRDVLGVGEDFGLDWGNLTGTLRWNHVFSPKLFSNTSLIYSDYNYQFSIGSEDEGFAFSSGINDYNLKQDFSYFLNNNNSLNFGGNVIYHTFIPSQIKAGVNSGFNPESVDPQYALEGALYLMNEMKSGVRWTWQYGLRYSFFNYLGAGTKYTFDAEGNEVGAESYDQWESIQWYNGLEPRLATTYLLNETSSLKASYNRMYQYMHLLSNSTTGTPTDRWVPSSNNVKPQIADQVAVGYFKNFSGFEFSVETYFKWLDNMIDYRNGANLVFNSAVEGELIYGQGRAYGLELFLKKNIGHFTGWFSYTLSRTERMFADIDNGNPFPARQDRTHDMSITIMYSPSEKWTFSGNFVYYTGDAATFPSGQYQLNGQVVPYYTERNGYRFPDYHRLDLGATYMVKKTDKFESSWNFSIYNAYGRENPYTITFAPNPENPSVNQATQVSLFKWVPSISYNFKF